MTPAFAFLTGKDFLNYYGLLVMIANAVEVKDRREVEALHFVGAAGSVNLESVVNSPDQWSQKGALVRTDQVSVHLQSPAASALTETCMTAQTPG